MPFSPEYMPILPRSSAPWRAITGSTAVAYTSSFQLNSAVRVTIAPSRDTSKRLPVGVVVVPPVPVAPPVPG